VVFKFLVGKKLLPIFTGLNNDLKADKENLQKQLELVTLRLPPPRVGFWARLFGGGKKRIERLGKDTGYPN
jgi:hypothetical protein